MPNNQLNNPAAVRLLARRHAVRARGAIVVTRKVYAKRARIYQTTIRDGFFCLCVEANLRTSSLQQALDRWEPLTGSFERRAA